MEGGERLMMGRYGDWGYGHMFDYGFGFGWIFVLIVWALIIWAIIAFVRAASGKGGSNWSTHEKEDYAMKILKERYAKGEITKEEFEKMKKDLLG